MLNKKNQISITWLAFHQHGVTERSMIDVIDMIDMMKVIDINKGKVRTR